MPRLARFALLALIVPVSLSAQTPARYDTSLFRALAWRLVGPFRGGRVTAVAGVLDQPRVYYIDRKSTRLNSSHVEISYAVFCLKKKKHSMLEPSLTPAVHVLRRSRP